MIRDFSVSAVVAGVIAVIVSYAGPLVIVFQAAQAAGLSEVATSSWIGAISIGSGVAAIGLSLAFRAPIVTAWSTPGAALLVVSLPHMSYPEAVGAFLVSAAICTIIGVSGLFDAVVSRVPKSIGAALLAGILVRFGLEVFGALRTDPWIVGPMVGAYFAVKRLSPRYAVTAVLLTGLGAAFAFGRVDGHAFRFELATPVLTAPAFTWSALTGLALPLALVTLTGQFVPGIAVLRTFGYSTPANPLVAVTSFVSVLLAPFGSHGVNLAAITAAICSGPAAHPQADRRYVAGVALGVAYVVAGLFGATLAGLFAALPASLIAALAGLALLGAIGNGLAAAMAAEGDDAREAALITFLVTASGISVLGLGSVVWGLLGGLLALAATRLRFRREAFPTAPPAAPRTATP